MTGSRMVAYSEENYRREIESLFVRFPSVQNAPFAKAYKPGLARMKEFDRLLGYPHRYFRCIHVAGTNGKGSVANMLASSLSAAGLKCGLFTSPHILDFRERMRIASPLQGRPAASSDVSLCMVPREWVHNFIQEWRADFERLDLSFFEITTAMAFKWFSEEGVDVAVIEVGLGGRLDSTNIITPCLSIVTSIGLDHCDLLGHSLADIAGEKAGIFKEGVPALVGEVLPETEQVFTEKAALVHAPLWFAQRMFPPLWEEKDEILTNMDLRGECQAGNLRTVLSALELLKELLSRPGLTVDVSEIGSGDGCFVGSRESVSEKIKIGIENTASRMDFHGRWERLSESPLVLCDIGHNAHALKGNFAQLECMLAGGECSSLTIVYAVMADKDLAAIIPLMPADAKYVFTTPSTSRALPAEEILRQVRNYRELAGLPLDGLFTAPDVATAVKFALELAGDSSRDVPPLVYIGGSTFLVSEALPIFKNGHFSLS